MAVKTITIIPTIGASSVTFSGLAFSTIIAVHRTGALNALVKTTPAPSSQTCKYLGGFLAKIQFASNLKFGPGETVFIIYKVPLI